MDLLSLAVHYSVEFTCMRRGRLDTDDHIISTHCHDLGLVLLARVQPAYSVVGVGGNSIKLPVIVNFKL